MYNFTIKDDLQRLINLGKVKYEIENTNDEIGSLKYEIRKNK